MFKHILYWTLQITGIKFKQIKAVSFKSGVLNTDVSSLTYWDSPPFTLPGVMDWIQSSPFKSDGIVHAKRYREYNTMAPTCWGGGGGQTKVKKVQTKYDKYKLGHPVVYFNTRLVLPSQELQQLLTDATV
jgi:hypothetical protein